jgi:hypothetical protein
MAAKNKKRVRKYRSDTFDHFEKVRFAAERSEGTVEVMGMVLDRLTRDERHRNKPADLMRSIIDEMDLELPVCLLTGAIDAWFNEQEEPGVVVPVKAKPAAKIAPVKAESAENQHRSSATTNPPNPPTDKSVPVAEAMGLEAEEYFDGFRDETYAEEPPGANWEMDADWWR